MTSPISIPKYSIYITSVRGYTNTDPETPPADRTVLSVQEAAALYLRHCADTPAAMRALVLDDEFNRDVVLEFHTNMDFFVHVSDPDTLLAFLDLIQTGSDNVGTMYCSLDGYLGSISSIMSPKQDGECAIRQIAERVRANPAYKVPMYISIHTRDNDMRFRMGKYAREIRTIKRDALAGDL